MSTPIAIENKNIVIISEADEMRVLRKYAIKYPDVLKVLLDHPKGYCPFLKECKKFPCETLNCNYEELSSGYPMKRS